ncbi:MULTISPECIES: outer membrane protein assembly factor BamB family protein [Streptomycetaceae]|uniref:Serine/threonine-protein kinase AfsK n=1 Tax=Streptantibioticus cattleyicolor (strain ATCC 35852 / DSM 46488 / JCM 4925 / NBRC 14057 / NRRL 8057) TaxID=1003195 RepID=F8JZ45_STREN|nr:PQQ-binding-like beta-propeller repeat protein [Streptantibioticus cattleyicolor]AEW94711.1 serine/threonine protein kinase [Streptantibioticus cattleyicolor NRRL 8057 = DSM 46488]MYS59342.1 PQQ-binding-like beta-propeller repeat protein [Streptomyces sp. SID5468]CCB75067.1 Serine/threonine-protein kinase afsK [Streptantibioticus cattleyicolor NRRL 8057 = DSM 46488]
MVEQLSQHDPRRIGPFEVLGRLGAGGMGLVYLARSASGRRVAIKTVRAELAEDQLFRVRFTREVEAARAVSGFYTAAVVDADPRAAVPWLATAYVPAPSLEEIVNESGPLPAPAVRWLAAGIAEALQSIHGAGLVHRDLKPSNVLVVEDGPRVIDFGIASGVSSTRLTMTNVAVGTPAYMSPEQARDSRSVTGASDIFSLGSTLLFAATGHPPFHGGNPVETVFMLLREAPDMSGLPDELRPLIESCMRKEADRRPTPADLQAQLAPHLFASGGDDSGSASAWLPANAVAMIEERGGRRRAAAAAAAPPPPPLPPPPPSAEPVGAPAGGGRHAVAERSDPRPAVAVGGGAAGPVKLAGSVPIGPGPRVADGKELRGTQAVGPVPGLGWSARGQGVTGMTGPGRPSASSAPGAVPPPPSAPPVVPPPAPSGPPVQVVQPVQPAPSAPSATRAEPDPRWRPWRFRMSNDVWGTPVVAGNRLYVTSFEIHALDVATGQRQFKTRDVAWTMAVADGRVHASDGPSLYALDAADGGERWRLAVDGWVYTIGVAPGTVVTGTRGGGVQGWDAASGELRWERAGAQADFETPESGPAVVDGRVYYRGGGRLHALDPHSGTVRWSAPVDDGMPVRPVAAEGSVYVVAGTRVLSLDAATGAERWRFDAPAVMFAPVTVAGGSVFAVDYLGTVHAIDPRTGGRRWHVATEARQSVEPVLVSDGLVHLGSGGGLYTLDAVSGAPKWRFATQGDIVGAPVAADGRIHFGSMDHCLYTVDASGGQLRWKLETGGEITGTPVVRDGVVFACSKDRCVYALDAAKGTGVAPKR